MGKAIVICSGKGGTGKTTAAAALSGSLAQLGFNTLCIDADIYLKNLDLCLGLSDLALMDFSDVINGICPLVQAAVRHPLIDKLHFLTAPLSPAPHALDTDSMRELVCEAKDIYDFCLIDSPAGIGNGFKLASCAADLALVMSTPDNTSYRDGARVVIELTEFGIPDIRLIVNRVRPSLLGRLSSTIDDAVDAVCARLIGIVPEDKNVLISSNLGVPLPLYSPKGAAAAFSRIAKRLTGQYVKLKL